MNTMNIVKTDIEGVLIIEPRLFRDACGYFFYSFNERELVRCAQGRMLDVAVDIRKAPRLMESMWL